MLRSVRLLVRMMGHVMKAEYDWYDIRRLKLQCIAIDTSSSHGLRVSASTVLTATGCR